MSFNTFLGALAGFGLFLGAVMLATNNVAVFLSGASIILVLGGTLAAPFISCEARSVMLGLTAITSAFRLHRVCQGGPQWRGRPRYPLGLPGAEGRHAGRRRGVQEDAGLG